MTEKEIGAMQVVNKHALFAGGAGLVPVPLFDLAAIAAVQLRMLSRLGKQYDIPVSHERGKAAISALLGSIIPTSLGYGIAANVMTRIPVVGSVLGMFTVGAFATASTYALGRVFIQHFESGGTFLDFDPAKVRAYYHEEFRKAQAA
jgi:uncharacterized protein (DUF697 family)